MLHPGSFFSLVRMRSEDSSADDSWACIRGSSQRCFSRRHTMKQPSPTPPPPPGPMPPLPPEAAGRLERFRHEVQSLTSSLVGYPVSQDYHYPEIAPFMEFS